MQDQEQPLSSGELAQLLGIDVTTISKHVARGLLPERRTLGRQLRFYPSEVRDSFERAGLPLPKAFAAFLAQQPAASSKGGAS